METWTRYSMFTTIRSRSTLDSSISGAFEWCAEWNSDSNVREHVIVCTHYTQHTTIVEDAKFRSTESTVIRLCWLLLSQFASQPRFVSTAYSCWNKTQRTHTHGTHIYAIHTRLCNIWAISQKPVWNDRTQDTNVLERERTDRVQTNNVWMCKCM